MSASLEIALEVALLRKAGNLPLTKRIWLGSDGSSLVSDGSACFMSRGFAQRFRFANLVELAEVIESFDSDQALTLGSLRSDLPARVEVAAKHQVNGSNRPDLVARTKDFFVYRPGEPSLALVDFDQKGMPGYVAEDIRRCGGLWKVLTSVLPALPKIARMERRSTSSGVYRADTGQKLDGSGGLHIFLPIEDGEDCERFLKTLHDRLWLAGFGWMIVGAAGQLLERSIVDRVVGSPERLVFEGPPLLDPPLAQDKAARRPVTTGGDILNSGAACPSLSILEKAKLNELRAKEAARLKPHADKARQAFITEQGRQLSTRTGIVYHMAARITERQCSGVLLSDVVLPFDDEELAGATVADVLADPTKYENATLADPLEGPQYGTGKAKIMRRDDGTPWVHSFAHGRTIYELKYDFRHAEAALNQAAAAKESIGEAFARAVLTGDLGEDEVERLRNLASELGGIGKRTVERILKQARGEHRASQQREQREQRLASRRDPRPQIPAPATDAPWIPQMGVLNDVLGGSTATEPPMRDIDGVVVQVRTRRPPKMHALTAEGANDEEQKETRLPPPELPLLTRLNVDQLAELIERHIDYIDETEDPVHLGAPFVRHFLTRYDEKLPTATAIATLPIVLGDGTVLGGMGLDRERGIVFRVPPELSAFLPEKSECSASAVAKAMHFLADEWLCDVATDYAGKCTLIAAPLTIIERSLLPDRPTFWVTAGRRGGGKTTTIMMLIMAVTGIRPAAAAWSPNEEERRKALLSYLLEALPCVVWDNIPRGFQISCPHIEKSCTSEFYSDRVLGASETVAASAATVHFFTGNNIGPRGDFSSRSLVTRLDVNRPDPENREFKHPDPTAWTEAHRGEILHALYTIALGNPRFHRSGPVSAQTRFKTWWHLVGQAVEHAAEQHKKHVDGLAEDADKNCPPEPIKFKDLFLSQEEDDQEIADLADALVVLSDQWPKEAPFNAKDVAGLINTAGDFPPAETRESGQTLREFLFPGPQSPQLVGAKNVTKRLKRHVGDPVRIRDSVLTLRGKQDSHTKNFIFWVASRSDV